MDRPPSPLAEIASSPDIGCISKAAEVYRSIRFIKVKSKQSDVMTNFIFRGALYVAEALSPPSTSAIAASNASALSRKSIASTIYAPNKWNQLRIIFS